MFQDLEMLLAVLGHVYFSSTLWKFCKNVQVCPFLKSLPLILKSPADGVPFLPSSQALFPGDLPYRGIEPGSPALQADSLPFELPGKPFYYWQYYFIIYVI